MSTTSKYNFIFLIPLSITDIPIPFEQFRISTQEETPQEMSFYSYNQYMELQGNQAFFTPSGSHALLSTNVTSIFDLAQRFPQYLAYVAPHIIIKEGVDMAAWVDENQANYLWIITTEPNLEYNFDKFMEASIL